MLLRQPLLFRLAQILKMNQRHAQKSTEPGSKASVSGKVRVSPQQHSVSRLDFLMRYVLSPLKNPEHKENTNQGNGEKHDPALAVQPSR